jgi:hypothetical protein
MQRAKHEFEEQCEGIFFSTLFIQGCIVYDPRKQAQNPLKNERGNNIGDPRYTTTYVGEKTQQEEGPLERVVCRGNGASEYLWNSVEGWTSEKIMGTMDGEFKTARIGPGVR